MNSNFINKKIASIIASLWLIFLSTFIPSFMAVAGNLSIKNMNGYRIIPDLSTHAHNSWSIKTFCQTSGGGYHSCYVIAASKNHNLVIEGKQSTRQTVPPPTTVSYIGNNIFLIMTSCGTDCNDTLYFSPPNRIAHWFTVMADNPLNETVATLGDNGHLNKIEIYHMFSKKRRPLISFETSNINSYPSVDILKDRVNISYISDSGRRMRKVFMLPNK